MVVFRLEMGERTDEGKQKAKLFAGSTPGEPLDFCGDLEMGSKESSVFMDALGFGCMKMVGVGLKILADDGTPIFDH